MNPGFNERNWTPGRGAGARGRSFRAASARWGPPPEGDLVLTWMGKGKKAQFGIQMHNPGLYDEYKEIWVEENRPSTSCCR